MNATTIITSIIALLGGFVAGNIVTNDSTPDQDFEQITNQAQVRFMSENPLAQDFVSLRPDISELPAEDLSSEETAGLLFMREEEKLARDVYQALYEKWGLKIFANIAQSEQTHTEAIRDLIQKYGLKDPVANDSIGVFTNTDLQKLYEDLVTEGSKSETDALKVGATIEDLDINDLADFATTVDNQDILFVYDNLARGSRNHLRSFVTQLSARGETYKPQYISTTEYETILNSSMENGQNVRTNNTQRGRGWGGGGKRQ